MIIEPRDIIALLGLGVTSLFSTLAYVSSKRNGRNVQTVQVQLDGQLEAWRRDHEASAALREVVAKAAGKLEGVAEERNRPMVPVHDIHPKPAPVEVVNVHPVPVVLEGAKH